MVHCTILRTIIEGKLQTENIIKIGKRINQAENEFWHIISSLIVRKVSIMIELQYTFVFTNLMTLYLYFLNIKKNYLVLILFQILSDN